MPAVLALLRGGHRVRRRLGAHRLPRGRGDAVRRGAAGSALRPLGGLALPAVVSAVAAASPMTQVLTIRDAGRTLEVVVGARLELRLPDNPSTGHRWTVAADPRFVLFEEGAYTQLGQEPGAGGERQWWITPREVGTTTLGLSRWRPWEGEQAAVERYAVTLRILPCDR